MPGAIPTISIGVPVYNGGEFVGVALQDLLRQSFGDFEIIISDNASTDATGEICRAIAARDPRVRYVRQDRNIGVLANFEFTLAQARGKYFCWAAADDRHDSDFLHALVAEIEKSPDIASVFCDFVDIDESGNVLAQWSFDFSASGPVARLGKYVFTRSHAKDVLFYGLHRRSALREAKFYRWWGVNASTPARSAYPIVAFMLGKGRYIHVKRRLFQRTTHYNQKARYPVPFIGQKFKQRMAKNLLEINAHVAMLDALYRATRSFSALALATPLVGSRFLFHPLYRNGKKLAHALRRPRRDDQKPY